MAHLSLYRRFRPDTFDKMVRQEHVVRVLKNQIEGGTVGHAYLFCGPRGTGKTSVARIFARAVNCEHPKDGSPCGECAVCRALKESTLDIAEIDAASNNGVAEMRDLREKVQYPPVSGRYKVYIIDEVHMLTDSAFNALLKTLEEPPAHVIFILATTEQHKIPATILSRCMRLDFKLIPEADLEAHLIQILKEIGKEYEEAAVAAIARAGAGSDRDMLSIAEMCLAYSEKLTYEGVNAVLGSADFRETAALAEALVTCNAEGALERAERVLAEGKAVGSLCRDLLQFFNRLSVAKTCRNAEKLLALPADLYARVKEIAAAADGRAILRASEIFAKLESELRFTSSPRISLETAIVRVSTPEVDRDVDALLVRVAALERSLAEGAAPAQIARASQNPAQDAPEVAANAKDDRSEEDDPPPWEPMEEPVFDEAYYAGEAPRAPAKGNFAEPAPAKARSAESAPAEQPVFPASPAPAAQEGEQTAQTAFGKFLRVLRKTSKNGVLFTMCADLEARFEGSTLVLETDMETIYRSLTRDDRRAVMQEAFAQAGVSEFEVRLNKRDAQSEKSGIDALKRDFSDYPVEIK